MAKRKSLKKVPKETYTRDERIYTVGDHVYCTRYPDGVLSYGTIESFHPNSSVAPAFGFLCLMTESFRTGLMKDIIISPTKKMINRCDSAIAKQRGASKRKSKRN